LLRFGDWASPGGRDAKAIMAKTKNEARVAWNEAEEAYRAVVEPYIREQNTETMDKAAVLAIDKARVAADRCLDAYVRRALGT
jgi:hypothetical protein